ncbi:MAG: carboxylesterase family protein [Terracidiphilus sp.]|nr:carboxylesterase family protein [Terracidiphilus sp.]
MPLPQIAAAASDPVASTAAGRLRGRSHGEGAVFKGIPYAQPPVGALRWKAPLAPLPWNGERNAADFSAPCAQTNQGYNEESAKQGREDCLYLNVWTPEWPVKTSHAVMVWIHGGGNTAGSASRQSFDRQTLSKQGIVLVTINYRVGALGFFSHPELTAENEHRSSGNYGLLDQIAALTWVKQNIANFGGDPDNVTIAGQSAGAIDLGLLMTSPRASGLFHRAIAESGTVLVYQKLTPPLRSAEETGIQFAQKLRAPDKDAVGYLRSLSVEQIVSASQGLPADPNVDGWVIPRLPAEVYLEGRERHIPMLIGNNGREHVFAGAEDALEKAIRKSFGSRATEAVTLYKQAETRQYAPYGSAGDQYSTDTSFRCASIGIAQWHHRAGNAVFQYEFTAGPLDRGARHSDELDYVFSGANGRTTPELKNDGASIQRYWANFAKTGNPSGPGVLPWPNYDDAAKSYMEFSNSGPQVKHNLREPYCDLLISEFSDGLRRTTKDK